VSGEESEGTVSGKAMNIRWTSVVAFVGASLFTSASYAESNKVLYELQKRCGKQASNKFKKEMGRNITRISEGKAIASYENHYNARLNRCLSLLEIRTIGETGGTSLRLFELHEKSNLGKFFGFDGSEPTECKVGDNFCHTEQEWRELVKPFMED
jgi:hypothetical protein